jgi:hypothetical protein
MTLIEICDLPSDLKSNLNLDFISLPRFEIFRGFLENEEEEEISRLYLNSEKKENPALIGRIWGICGPPGSGKSSFVRQAALDGIKNEQRIIWFDTEGSCSLSGLPNLRVIRTYDAIQLLASVRCLIPGSADFIIVDSVGFAFRHCDIRVREVMVRLMVSELLTLGRCRVLLVNQTTTRVSEDSYEVVPLLDSLWSKLVEHDNIIKY